MRYSYFRLNDHVQFVLEVNLVFFAREIIEV